MFQQPVVCSFDVASCREGRGGSILYQNRLHEGDVRAARSQGGFQQRVQDMRRCAAGVRRCGWAAGQEILRADGLEHREEPGRLGAGQMLQIARDAEDSARLLLRPVHAVEDLLTLPELFPGEPHHHERSLGVEVDSGRIRPLRW